MKSSSPKGSAKAKGTSRRTSARNAAGKSSGSKPAEAPVDVGAAAANDQQAVGAASQAVVNQQPIPYAEIGAGGSSLLALGLTYAAGYSWLPIACTTLGVGGLAFAVLKPLLTLVDSITETSKEATEAVKLGKETVGSANAAIADLQNRVADIHEQINTLIENPDYDTDQKADLNRFLQELHDASKTINEQTLPNVTRLTRQFQGFFGGGAFGGAAAPGADEDRIESPAQRGRR